MQFFIRQNSTLPILKVEIIRDSSVSFREIYDGLIESTLTFSMKDLSNDRYVILNDLANIDIVKDENDNITNVFISYQFSKKQTKRIGEFIGEFKLNYLGRSLSLPLENNLFINVVESISNSDLCCKPNRDKISIVPNLSQPPTPSPTTTPTPTVTPTITPTTTPSVTVTPTVTPTITPSISISPTTTVTPTITPTVTPSISISPTTTVTPTTTPTVTPSISISPTTTVTPTVTPSISISPTTTVTPTVTPSISISPTTTVTPTVTPTTTPVSSPGIPPPFTLTPTPTPSFDSQNFFMKCVSVVKNFFMECVSIVVDIPVTPSITLSATPTPTPSKNN